MPKDTRTPAPAPRPDRPWAIQHSALHEVTEALRWRASNIVEAAELDAKAADLSRSARADRNGSRVAGAVAVIPLRGVITPRPSLMSFLFGGGGSGLIDFMEEFRAAVNDDDIGSVLIDIDSPGGRVDLVPEAAEEIRAARGTKPIVAIANTISASAAYWLAAQADELVVTPSGQVGSVGVYMLHEDWSGFNEQMGIAPTYVYAGKYKVEGNPDEPLSDAAKAAWQTDVDDVYGMFVDAVAAARGTTTKAVRDGYGEGRVLNAQRALDATMVDRVETFEDTVARLVSGSTAPAAGAVTAAAAARARLVADQTPAIQDVADDTTGDEPDDDPSATTTTPPAETGDEVTAAASPSWHTATERRHF